MKIFTYIAFYVFNEKYFKQISVNDIIKEAT